MSRVSSWKEIEIIRFVKTKEIQIKSRKQVQDSRKQNLFVKERFVDDGRNFIIRERWELSFYLFDI